jgi:hypothetical protein
MEGNALIRTEADGAYHASEAVIGMYQWIGIAERHEGLQNIATSAPRNGGRLHREASSLRRASEAFIG